MRQLLIKTRNEPLLNSYSTHAGAGSLLTAGPGYNSKRIFNIVANIGGKVAICSKLCELQISSFEFPARFRSSARIGFRVVCNVAKHC
jgi:hypothetical protein